MNLHKEWALNINNYKNIIELIDSPFTKPAENEWGWLYYSSWLKSLPEERMFNEAFSLKDVYIPLRASYNTQTNDENELNKISDSFSKKIVLIQDHIRKWISNEDKNDCIKIITGGPGCGKSTFAKILVAYLSGNTDIRILFIPLHLFNLSLSLIHI